MLIIEANILITTAFSFVVACLANRQGAADL